MLYTIIPMEQIYPEKLPGQVEKRINGLSMLCVPGPDGTDHPVRLLSTDLRDFLKYEMR